MDFNDPHIPQQMRSGLSRAVRQILSFPWRLWRVATASLPTASTDNEGGLVYDSDLNLPKFSDGTAWRSIFSSSNAALNAISALTPAADRYVYFTSASAAALGTITSFGRSLIDDADASTARSTLGLGTSAVKNTGTSGDAVPLCDGTAVTWTNGATFGGSVSVTGDIISTAALAGGTWMGGSCVRANGLDGIADARTVRPGLGVELVVETGVGYILSYNPAVGFGPLGFLGSRYDMTVASLTNAADDAAAAAAGVAVGTLYRNGSQLMVRVA